MCVFELVLGGDEKGGEVLGQEASVGGRVGKQDLRILKDFRFASTPTLETPATEATSLATAAQPVPATRQFTCG